MSRIQRAYENSFRALLAGFRARQAEKGIRHLLERARFLQRNGQMSPAKSLAGLQTELKQKLLRWQVRATSGHRPIPLPERFLCDAGLGGLAWWLRAAGYESFWIPGIADDDLLQEATRLSAVMLTTDSLLMERRRIRDGEIAAIWIPPTFTVSEQLQILFLEIPLRRREPRCTRCGGKLLTVDKEAVREKIPPRTYRWIDQYYQCERCQKLFWRGTHWRRIEAELNSFHGGGKSAVGVASPG